MYIKKLEEFKNFYRFQGYQYISQILYRYFETGFEFLNFQNENFIFSVLISFP